MPDDFKKLNLEEILGGDFDINGEEQPNAHWPKLDPKILSVFALVDCNEQLERRLENPLRLVFAAKSAYLAMHGGLVAAIAGSANIGAYEPKVRAQFLAYFEASRDGSSVRPSTDRVMRFADLLDQAMKIPLEQSGKPLQLTQQQRTLIERLVYIRDMTEHPRPRFEIFEPRYISAAIAVAAHVTGELLSETRPYLRQAEIETVKKCIGSICQRCACVE